jgi:hypothetical protein
MILKNWLKVKSKQNENTKRNIMRKKGVLQLALQLNFWITNDTCNSLYLYAMNFNGQVAWIAKLQLAIYTM